MRYAIQRIDNGQVIDYCDTPEQAAGLLSIENPKMELVDTTKTSYIKAVYTELGGPHGYGHQEESFATYGGITRCLAHFYRWAKSETHIWGPYASDLKIHFRHYHIEINGEDKTDWFQAQVDKIKGLYL